MNFTRKQEKFLIGLGLTSLLENSVKPIRKKGRKRGSIKTKIATKMLKKWTNKK